MKKTNKKSTFEKEMENSKFQKLFKKEYTEFVLSELILSLMENDKTSVRKLAKEIGVSPSVIQSVRSGKQSNITLKSFQKMLQALGSELGVKYGDEFIPLKIAA